MSLPADESTSLAPAIYATTSGRRRVMTPERFEQDKRYLTGVAVVCGMLRRGMIESATARRLRKDAPRFFRP